MIASLFCMAIGLGVVFAWTRSLIPSIIAHAIINIPMTPRWQGALLVVFAIGALFVWRGGVRAAKQVFMNTRVTACTVLTLAQTIYVIEAHRVDGMTQIAIGMLVVALGLEAIDRRKSRMAKAAPISAPIR